MDEKETNTTENKQTSKKNYVVTAICYLALVALCTVNEGVFQKESAREVMGAISNAFFLPGMLFAGIGGISKIASTGEFDMLGYGFSTIGIHQLIPGFPKDKYESYLEYKTAKDERGRRWFPNMLFVGMAGIFVSAVFVMIYSFM